MVDQHLGGRVGREALVERGLQPRMAEHAEPGARDGHAHAAVGLGDEDAHQGEARGGLLELEVRGLLRHGKAHGRDQLAAAQRRGVHALEEVVGRDLAPVGDDGGAQAQHGAGVAGSGVVVGQRAADGAARTHLAVADAAGQLGQGRDGGLDLRVGGHVGMARHGADFHGLAVDGDAGQALDAVQVHDLFGPRQAQAHRWQQALAAGQVLAALRGQRGGVGRGARGFIGECVHGALLRRWLRRRWPTRHGAGWPACPGP